MRPNFNIHKIKKILPFTLIGIVIIVIGLILFIKLDTEQAANFTDQMLRPLIGDSQVIYLEKIFFNSSDSLNQLRYKFVPAQNPFLGKDNTALYATSTETQSSNLDLTRIPTTASVPLADEGVWHNIPLTLFPQKIIMADAFIRPDSNRTYAFATVVQLDMGALRLSTVAGIKEPGGKVGKPGSGVVPQDVQKAGMLVAAFNGGFQYKDGQYGMIVGTTTYLPLKKDMATLVAHTNGKLEIIKYEGQNLGSDIAFVRQNCPMLIENGVVETQDENNRKLWGRTNTSSIYTWRSGIGITAKGNLVFVAGNSLVPSTLAAALKAAGAVNAMQLDINPNWVRFNIFNSYSKGKYISNTIMEGLKDGSVGYLTGYNKDFFYVTKK